jgi:ribose-phosphate pyrophosphokinase
VLCLPACPTVCSPAVDDMVDTAGTLCKAVDVLLEQGARRVFAFCSHGVLSGPAASRIKNSNLTELVVLDTIPLSEELKVRRKVPLLILVLL